MNVSSLLLNDYDYINTSVDVCPDRMFLLATSESDVLEVTEGLNNS